MRRSCARSAWSPLLTTSAFRLHRNLLSGHSHRAQLLLSLLGLPVELIDVDMSKGEHKSPEFLKKNPWGQVPVFEDKDKDLTLTDSNAILVYLALKYDETGKWYPRDPVIAAKVQVWLSVAAGQMVQGPFYARLHKLFGAPVDHGKAKAAAEKLFEVLDRELATGTFLAGDWPTIADVAIYTYTAHAPEGEVSLEPYGNVRSWLQRIEQLKGFMPMVRAADLKR